jgi:MerR family copper efflux transcriptional regulator
MRIGEVARLASVRVDTVRFYERRGLLPEPARRPSGYRVYSMVTVERVRFAKALQHLGFTLDDVASVLADVDRGAATCAAERRRFEAVLLRVDEKLAELRRVRRRLVGTLSRCESGECRLLEGATAPKPARRASS